MLVSVLSTELSPLIKKYKDESIFVADYRQGEANQVPSTFGRSWEFYGLRRRFTRLLLVICRIWQMCHYDILVFFSPSGIESLFHNFPDFQQNEYAS